MKLNENQKITLTIAQLRKLVSESIRDIPQIGSIKDFDEPEGEDEINARNSARARYKEMEDEIREFLKDNGVEPFENGRDYLQVRRYNGWNEGEGRWSIEVFDTQIDFYDNGRVRWSGGRTLSGFDLDDEGDEDEDSVAAKKRLRFIQKCMNDKGFIRDLKEIVLRVGNEQKRLGDDLWRRRTDREKIGTDRYNAARAERIEKIRQEVKTAKFALISIHDDDRTGILYRNKPCKVIEVGDSEDELYEIAWHPWNHREYQKDVTSAGRDIRVVSVRLLKGL